MKTSRITLTDAGKRSALAGNIGKGPGYAASEDQY
jgi:hypothetical protein